MRMLKVAQTEDGYRLKQNPGALSIFMAFLSFMLLRVGFGWVRMIMEETDRDVIGIVFIAVWLLIGLSVLVFGMLRKLFSYVEISSEGITYTDWFKKKNILWCELKDYGISFEGRSKGVNNYTLFFSDEILPEKNMNKKKLKGVAIKLDMVQVDYAGIYTKLIPYCNRYTGLKPFLPTRVP